MAVLRRGREAYQRDERVFESTEFVEQLPRTVAGPARGAPRCPPLDLVVARVCRHVEIPLLLGVRPQAVYQAVARGRDDRMNWEHVLG